MTSADLTEQLRASRPVAPGALRERVRAIATAETAPSRLSSFRLPRLRLVVPVAAATAVAAAALIALVRPRAPAAGTKRSRARSRENRGQPLPHPDDKHRHRAGSSRHDHGPAGSEGGRRAGARQPRCQRWSASSGNHRARAGLPGADRPRGKGQRRALERDQAGDDDRARPRRLRRRRPVRLLRHGHRVAHPPRAECTRARRDRSADRARPDHVTAGADPGPAGAARPARPPDCRPAPADRAHHCAAHGSEPDARAPRTARGTPSSAADRPARHASAASRHRPGSSARDDSALTGDEGSIGHRRRCPLLGSTGCSTRLAGSSRWEGVALLYALVVIAPFAPRGALAWFGTRDASA